MYYEAESYPSPGLPVKDPCLSFWLQNTRSSSLLGYRTTESLPSSADVVIIGSGLSGAATAYYLLAGSNAPKSVLMLEAREACDGATGRNGGHCRPYVFQGHHEYKEIFGREEALKISALEMANLHLMAELIEKEQIDCDFWLGESFETCIDPEAANKKLRSYQEFKDDGGPLEGVVKLTTNVDEAKRTHTPVTAVTSTSTSLSAHDPRLSTVEWIVTTPRGKVTANKVVFATNAYTATLLPEFLGNIVPGQGQCAAIVPTPSFSGTRMMEKTCCYHWGKDNFDYLIQRPKDGVIILGGGKASASHPGAILGCTNDSGRPDDGGKQAEITEYLKGAMGEYFVGWNESDYSSGSGAHPDQKRESLRVGEGLLYDWTGIMGYTRDSQYAFRVFKRIPIIVIDIPFVGNVEGKPGAYVIAGHCGHGMARIASCAKGLATLMSGGSWLDTGLPGCFQPTKERMRDKKMETTT
ncbi:hypothetical protein HHX47_DHR2000802 [Lentinula edodes]|nr:hypothetical protein HHX47_DHR2000802 [Lentinula edodes]